MKEYDKVNKIKEEKNKEIARLNEEINALKEKNEKLEAKNKELRQKLHDAGEGKSEVSRLKNQLTEKERNERTLQHRLDEAEGKHILSIFTKERQELILKIRKLHYSNSIFNSLAYKFQDGTENVIQIAYKIKNNSVGDMDFYTFVFRDDIVGLLEKILRILTKSIKTSASYYLLDLRDNKCKLPNKYYKAVPKLQNTKVIGDILSLINIESKAYHGSTVKEKRVIYDEEDDSTKKYYDFLNVNRTDQLTAIFTLLEFIYYFFTCDDHEQNLINLSSYWFKTI